MYTLAFLSAETSDATLAVLKNASDSLLDALGEA